MVGDADLESDFVVQLDFHGRPAVCLDLFGLAAVAAHSADCQAAHFGPIKGFEDVVQFFGSNYRNYQFHFQPPSAWTRIAPSPLLYASSPCCVTSRPIPSSFALARTLNAKAMILMMTNVATPLYRIVATTAALCTPSCRIFPN